MRALNFVDLEASCRLLHIYLKQLNRIYFYGLLFYYNPLISDFVLNIESVNVIAAKTNVLVSYILAIFEIIDS
jgi:hypothetical protein